MTEPKLCSLIAMREGKKNQARIGEIREIVKVIFTLAAEDRLRGVSEVEDVIKTGIGRVENKLRKKR